MTHKIFCLALYALLLALCPSAEAQQPKTRVPRIGYLDTRHAGTESRAFDAFRQGLRELGYIEGETIIIEYRTTEGNREKLLGLATELVGLKLDAIVGTSRGVVTALAQRTKTTPVVMASGADPVAGGLAASFARPGGNITGISNLMADLDPKRLELLKESFPKISRVAMLGDAQIQNGNRKKDLDTAARSLGIKALMLEVQAGKDLEREFEAAIKQKAHALAVLPAPFFGDAMRKRIVELAAKNRFPAIYPIARYTEFGGLMSYGTGAAETHRRSAYFVDRILKGSKPADLPIEQPTKFEFVINLKAAKQIGVTIPPNVLARADKVIR